MHDALPRTIPWRRIAGKLEFDYSVLRKGVGKMVAVVMEPGMRNPKNWVGVVGAKLGTSLYVDLTGDHTDEDFTTGIQHLVREIEDRACRHGAALQQPTAHRAPPPPSEGTCRRSERTRRRCAWRAFVAEWTLGGAERAGDASVEAAGVWADPDPERSLDEPRTQP